jgi:dolichyl-diphosphooligosaccharide--protein glycosyltransferase/undecaprenyl-diphosphooligosaccharide--protein glycosyltransferase
MKLQLPNESLNTKTVVLLILIAYLFSLSMRYLWVMDVQGIEAFHWNNALMINTNDGYFFAEGARDILRGSHQAYDLSPVDNPASLLTAWLSKIIPVSFETLILAMPAFIGSLIVIPLILVGRAFNQTAMGFIAALIASIAHSYYNRTMTGYYDTDMLAIVLPLFSLYFIVLALLHQRNRYLLPVTITFALYQWWYPQGYALNTAILVTVLLYALAFERKNHYVYKISLFIIIGILTLPIWMKLSIALAVFAFFHFQPKLDQKWFWFLFAGMVALYFGTGGIDPIWGFLKSYVLRESVSTDTAELHFYNVAQTVREAGNIPFTVFAERISGHTITFLLACIGYALAVFAYRPFLISLPFVALGFIAMSSGLRFTIYAVPAMALGFAYFLLFITQPIEKRWLRSITLFVFTVAALYPNYLHIKEYMTPTVFTAQEVSTLDKLGKIASREDYVISWWDYGYPIRYYSDVKTLVDGGKHTGDVNYPASYILTHPIQNAAFMARLSIEYTEKSFENNNSAIISEMLKDYKADTVDDMMVNFQMGSEALPKPTRDVYLYLPLRMMEILPTVTLFSYLDLQNPDNKPEQPFFYATQQIQDTGKTIELGNGISILKEKSILKMGNQETPIKGFYQVGYNKSNVLQVNEQHFASEGLNVIYMASYGRFVIVDDFYFNSAYIQMFVFEHYDKNLFEPVLLDPMSKIYKLKV